MTTDFTDYMDCRGQKIRAMMDYLWKFLAGCAVWIAFAASRLPKILRGDKASKMSAVGLLFFAVLIGLIGLAIPAIWWPWFHLVIYPLTILAIFFLCIWLPFMFWWCSPMSDDKTKQSPKEKT